MVGFWILHCLLHSPLDTTFLIEDWFVISNLHILGREEGGHASFKTSEQSKSALAFTGAAKRYRHEYESARELGVQGSGHMIRE